MVDEEAYDLLQPQGGAGFNKGALKYHEWEGAYIQGINWVPINNSRELNQYFTGGNKNKTSRMTEFGKLSEKAAQLF